MKLYEVELVYRVVVCAENERAAYDIAIDETREISDNEDPEIEVGEQIQTRKQVTSGWDENCLPYGTKDDNTIGHYLQLVPR